MVGIALAIAVWFAVSILATAALLASGAYAPARGRRLERKLARQRAEGWVPPEGSRIGDRSNVVPLGEASSRTRPLLEQR